LRVYYKKIYKDNNYSICFGPAGKRQKSSKKEFFAEGPDDDDLDDLMDIEANGSDDDEGDNDEKQLA
jgi:hypothetical protein